MYNLVLPPWPFQDWFGRLVIVLLIYIKCTEERHGDPSCTQLTCSLDVTCLHEKYLLLPQDSPVFKHMTSVMVSEIIKIVVCAFSILSHQNIMQEIDIKDASLTLKGSWILIPKRVLKSANSNKYCKVEYNLSTVLTLYGVS